MPLNLEKLAGFNSGDLAKINRDLQRIQDWIMAHPIGVAGKDGRDGKDEQGAAFSQPASPGEGGLLYNNGGASEATSIPYEMVGYTFSIAGGGASWTVLTSLGNSLVVELGHISVGAATIRIFQDIKGLFLSSSPVYSAPPVSDFRGSQGYKSEWVVGGRVYNKAVMGSYKTKGDDPGGTSITRTFIADTSYKSAAARLSTGESPVLDRDYSNLTTTNPTITLTIIKRKIVNAAVPYDLPMRTIEGGNTFLSLVNSDTGETSTAGYDAIIDIGGINAGRLLAGYIDTAAITAEIANIQTLIGFSGEFDNILATGVSAEIVSADTLYTQSTGLVENLNSEFLDGHHFTEFVPYTGASKSLDLGGWDIIAAVGHLTSLNITGNLAITGTVDGVDVSDLKTNVDGFPAELKNLVTVEIQQLENISATVISEAQWAILGGLAATLTNTELNYVDGVTTGIQGQIDGKEPTIPTGTTAQYYRGDEAWATLNQAAVAGLTMADSPTLAGLTVTGLTASLPVVSDASKNLVSLAYTGATSLRKNLGLETDDSPTFTIPAVNGVKFPAAQASSANANTLDDYEEGDCTLVLTFGGGNTSMTTSHNTGYYTKIGNIVTVSGIVILTAKGSSTGVASVSGLPFTVYNDLTAIFPVSLWCYHFLYSGQIFAIATINTKSFDFWQTTEAGVSSQLTETAFRNTSQFSFSCTYRVE